MTAPCRMELCNRTARRESPYCNTHFMALLTAAYATPVRTPEVAAPVDSPLDMRAATSVARTSRTTGRAAAS